MILSLNLLVQGQIKFPENLEHDDPDKALIDYGQIRGTHWYAMNIAARDAIPVDKREVGMMVTVGTGIDNVTYRYDNSIVTDPQWQGASNWLAISTGLTWDSLQFNSDNGYVAWFKNDLKLDSALLDDRYIELADTLIRVITPTQLADTLTNYVEYDDSLDIFVTPTQLVDSINISNAISDQNRFILGTLLNNGFYEPHEFEVVEDGGVLYIEVWNSVNIYSVDSTYNRGNQVIDVFQRYYSNIDNNINNTPATSPDEWEPISIADFNLHGLIDGSGRTFTLNTTTGSGIDGHARVALTTGTDANPVINYVYSVMNGSTSLDLIASTIQITSPNIDLGFVEIGSVATTIAQGPVNEQRYTNGLYNEDLFKGQQQALREKARKRVSYSEGIVPTLTITPNGGALDNAVINTTFGITEQLWSQSFEANTGTPIFYCLNHPTNPITQEYTDLNELNVDANGVTLYNNNDRFAFRIWGNQASGTNAIDALYVTLPEGKYSTDNDALNNIPNYDINNIGGSFSSTFFNITIIRGREY